MKHSASCSFFEHVVPFGDRNGMGAEQRAYRTLDEITRGYVRNKIEDMQRPVLQGLLEPWSAVIEFTFPLQDRP